MSLTKMQEIANIGQSLWLDNISRSMLTNGKLKDLIDQGLRGQTSNPTIFKQAISLSTDYDAKIQDLSKLGRNTFEIYDELTIKDVADAADLFRPTYTKTGGLDGYVSLEINPQLANEIEAQLKEGLRLWKKLNRPNVMIKVPATKNGLVVVEELISQGVNVNVTLIFSAEQYNQVAWAYMNGLEQLASKGGDLNKVHSVASVFVSRVDSVVDKLIDEEMLKIHTPEKKLLYTQLRGTAAVSNCEIIFHKFNKLFSNDRFKKLAVKGAHVQRVLWASTGTKDSKYSDVKYIEELIASPTVNTIPDTTLQAYLDHGKVYLNLPKDVAIAQSRIENLRSLGIDVGVVCNQLLQNGVDAFITSFDDLSECIEVKGKQLSKII